MTLKQRSVVFKALGHPARLAVVERLGKGECCVCELLKGTEFRGLMSGLFTEVFTQIANVFILIFVDGIFGSNLSG